MGVNDFLISWTPVLLIRSDINQSFLLHKIKISTFFFPHPLCATYFTFSAFTGLWQYQYLSS